MTLAQEDAGSGFAVPSVTHAVGALDSATQAAARLVFPARHLR